MLAFCSICGIANAQCVAEVKDVIQDPQRGTIVVEVEYKLNGVVVNGGASPEPGALGRTRYNETTGTIPQIVTKAKTDIEEQCDALIIRNAIKVNNLKVAKAQIQKDITSPMISTLHANAVGWTKTVTQKLIQYKGKDITVEADGSYTITDSP